MSILVTGGAGYIGSHCVRILSDNGFEVVVLDNLSKGHKKAVSSGKLYIGDIGDSDILYKVFTENKIESVIHFAAFSVVPESMKNPYEYYKNNVSGTLNLLNNMVKHNVKSIVFSSTASTYGIPVNIPITEDDPQQPINVYGETKLAIEKMLKWFDTAYGVKSVILRYFNVAGAYKTGEIGEDHSPESHIIPLILSVANGNRTEFNINGNDYKTKDGTCIRDYLHVEDLIDAHIKSVLYIKEKGKSEYFNLGSGGGYSNLEILNAARNVTGHEIPSCFKERREGDPDILIASSEKAEKILKWTRKYNNIGDIIASAWRWHKNNPRGYN